MSRSRSDSTKNGSTVLELVRMDDGTFDLFLNSRLERSRVSEASLSEQICVRFGFRGTENRSILRAVHDHGRITATSGNQ
jgi:hypothetical protein